MSAANARLLVGLVVLVTACRQADELPSPTVVRFDSAGVKFVRVPPLGTFALPRFEARSLWSTASQTELFNVTDALFLADGSLVVANAGSNEILRFDDSGGVTARIGRAGEGPGEFRWAAALLPAPGGGFHVFDALASRLSTFDASMTLSDTRRVPSSNVTTTLPIVLLPDGRAVAVLGEQRFFLPEGERRDTVPVMVIHPDGAVDTLGVWMGLERAFASNASGSAIVPIGFGRTAYHAEGGDRIVMGSSDSLDLTVYSQGDLEPVLRIVAPDARTAPSPDDIRSWRSFIAADVPGVSAELTAAWANGPVRETIPAVGGLGIDPDGRVWVGAYALPRDDVRIWTVFDREGTPIAAVDLPVARGRLPGTHELLALGRGRLALLRRDELDVEFVEVWSYTVP